MHASVEKYGLGVFVGPDSAEAVENGLRTLLEGRAPAPQWEEHAKAASWELNAARTAKALGLSGRKGRLVPGHDADLAVWEVGSPAELCYWIGGPGPSALFAGGERLY